MQRRSQSCYLLFGLLMQLESLNKLCLDFQQTVFIVLYIYSHVISQQLLN